MRPPYSRSQNTPRPPARGREDNYAWDSFNQYPMYDEPSMSRPNSTFGAFGRYDDTPVRNPYDLGARPKDTQRAGFNRTYEARTPGTNRSQARPSPGLNGSRMGHSAERREERQQGAYGRADTSFRHERAPEYRAEEEAPREEARPDTVPPENRDTEPPAPGVAEDQGENVEEEGAVPEADGGNDADTAEDQQRDRAEEPHRDMPEEQPDENPGEQDGEPPGDMPGEFPGEQIRGQPGDRHYDHREQQRVPYRGQPDMHPDRDPYVAPHREPHRRRRDGGAGYDDDRADESDCLFLCTRFFGFIFACVFNLNLLVGMSAIGLTLYLTGIQVWQDMCLKYWSSPWMIQYTCIGGLILIMMFYLNKICWFKFNRSIIGLVKTICNRLANRSRRTVGNPHRSVNIRVDNNDETYIVNRGNTSHTFPSNYYGSTSSNNVSGSTGFHNSPGYTSPHPSGGWNGNYCTTSTPAASSHNPRSNHQSRNFRADSSHNPRSNHQSRNFRTDTGFRNLGNESPRINIREDLNTSHHNTSQNNEQSYYYSLSHEDRTIIDQLSPLASTHNLTLPKWNNKRETYEDFRLSFMSFVPTIPVLLRLESLKRALENCPEALRIISEFQDNSTEAFSGALLALDEEYDDMADVIERLTDGIQVITTTRAHSPDDFVNNMNKMTVLITKLSRRDPNTRLTLSPLVKEWLKYIPDNIDRQVIKNVEKFGRSWVTFENVYSLCMNFVKGWKNTRDLIARRAEAQKSQFKKSQAFVSETLPASSPVSSPVTEPAWNPPVNSSFEEKEVLYARTFGKPKCCFCHKDTHPSANCPDLAKLTDLQIAERFFNKNSMSESSLKVRCYLCVEQGHAVQNCILVQHNIIPPYQCTCTIKPVHNKLLCSAMANRNPTYPPKK